jgi:hypothetical protein
MRKNKIRQGDLLFIPVDGHFPRKDLTNLRSKTGVIKEGEATGHHHRLAKLDTADVYRRQPNGLQFSYPDQDADAFVVVKDRGATILHEEHKPVQLEPNTTYKVQVAREYDYLNDVSRQVMD